MKLYIARHGETDWNTDRRIQGSTDIELNERGLKQADELAQKLAEGGFHCEYVYSSHLKRAWKTAQIVAERLAIPCEIVEGLQEMCLGKWEGLKWEEVLQRYPQAYSAWHAERRYTRTPDGESYRDALERAVPALRAVAAAGHERVLVISHGAVIMSMLSWLKDKPFLDMGENYKFGNCTVVEVDSDELEERWRKARL